MLLPYPSEKSWISSVGMMTFPTEWKKNVTNHQSGENFRAKLDFEPAWIGFYPSNIDLKIPGLPMINPLKIPIVDG